jgi:hypothetical protein
MKSTAKTVKMMTIGTKTIRNAKNDDAPSCLALRSGDLRQFAESVVNTVMMSSTARPTPPSKSPA